jgi:rare lipoprotein A
MSFSPIKQLPLLLMCLALAGTAALGAEEFSESGIASWYGGKFQGRKTANGETFDTSQLTAAHKTLPFGTIVTVVNLQNEKSVEVRINDRGPFVEGRIIDLSRAGADAIGMVGSGVAPVRLEIISGPKDGVPEDLYGRHERGKTVTIQVASFSVEDNAERTRARLMREGIPAALERSAGGHFRVVIRNVDSTALPGIKTGLARLGYSSVLVREKQ